MWFGTFNGGVSRYDERGLQNLTTRDGLAHNVVRVICGTPDGILWIGTKGGGLNRYDREKDQFTSYQHNPDDPTSLSHNDVKCIFKDSGGTYWIGTEGGGLNKFDEENGKFTSYKNDPYDSLGLSYAYIFSTFNEIPLRFRELKAQTINEVILFLIELIALFLQEFLHYFE